MKGKQHCALLGWGILRAHITQSESSDRKSMKHDLKQVMYAHDEEILRWEQGKQLKVNSNGANILGQSHLYYAASGVC